MTVIDFRAGGYDDGYGQQHGGDSRYHAPSWDGADSRLGYADEARYAADPGSAPDVGGFAGRVTRLLNYLGALVSVALMVGLMVWGYRLVTRDVSGVPVIQALEGAARVAPADPGGEMGADKGLAVNAVAAGGDPVEAAELAMAPEAAGLAEEDVAMGTLGATTRDPGVLSETAPAPVEAAPVAVADAEAAALAAAQAERTALAFGEPLPAADAPAAFAAADIAATPADPASAAAEPATDAEAVDLAVLAAAAPEVAQSPRPQPRPQRLVRVASADPAAALAASPSSAVTLVEAPEPKAETETAEAVAEAPPAEAPKAVRQADLPAGSMVVQIGAFDSDKLARGEWSRVAGKNGALFDGKSQIVQKTEKGGRAFWRLRVAGFASRDEARSFCASLKAAGTDCIPTQAN